MSKLEQLEEVDLSGNLLKTVPTTIMSCRRMHTLIAHSNTIEVFPEVLQLQEMKVRVRVRVGGREGGETLGSNVRVCVCLHIWVDVCVSVWGRVSLGAREFDYG